MVHPLRSRRDAGSSALGNLLYLAAILVVVCGLYFLMDVRHRMAGYDAVHGKGITGTVRVTHCESDDWRAYCVGDFSSAEGRVVHKKVRVNGAARLLHWTGGPLTSPTELPAAMTGAGADDAWTADGVPWLEFSRVQIIAMAPLALAAALVWKLLGGGFYGKGPMDRLSPRESAKLRAMSRGRVY